MERPRRSATLDQWEVERSGFEPEALAARLVASEPRADRDAAELLAAVPGTVEWLREARPALYGDRAPPRERAPRPGERPQPPRGWIRVDTHEPFDARRPRAEEPEVESIARESTGAARWGAACGCARPRGSRADEGRSPTREDPTGSARARAPRRRRRRRATTDCAHCHQPGAARRGRRRPRARARIAGGARCRCPELVRR